MAALVAALLMGWPAGAGSLCAGEGAGCVLLRPPRARGALAGCCAPARLCLRGGGTGGPARSRRDESALPDFEHTTWRINASNAPGAWPGPATTLIVPTEEEFAELGNGPIYPGKHGDNVTLEEFVRCAVATARLLPVRRQPSSPCAPIPVGPQRRVPPA